MECALGVDVGGTSIKVGLLSLDGELLDQASVRTPALVDEGAYGVVTDALRELVGRNGVSVADVMALGLDVPTPVAADGRVGFVPNASIDADGLESAVADAFPGASLAFVNDANAAALGEMWRGAAVGVDDFVLIAIGTGVGAGVVIGGRVVAGAFGSGGEIGHLTVCRDESRACGCGRHGCLEQYASATGIVNSYLLECEARRVAPAPVEHGTDSLSVFRAMVAGDVCAAAAVDLMCESLGLAMAQVGCVVDPDLFLLGGGVAGSLELYAGRLRAGYEAHALPNCRDARIERAALGNAAAMYGSAFEALRLRD